MPRKFTDQDVHVLVSLITPLIAACGARLGVDLGGESGTEAFIYALETASAAIVPEIEESHAGGLCLAG
jgi:hypothetical protein